MIKLKVSFLFLSEIPIYLDQLYFITQLKNPLLKLSNKNNLMLNKICVNTHTFSTKPDTHKAFLLFSQFFQL